jgi:hypothetical protein
LRAEVLTPFPTNSTRQNAPGATIGPAFDPPHGPVALAIDVTAALWS